MSKANNRPRAAPTGRKYASVGAMMQAEGVSKVIQDKVRQLVSECHIATRLAQLRHQAGITQKEMADKLGVTQSAISQLEAGNDDSITLKQVKEYASLTGDKISMFFGRPYSHTEAVQICGNALKYRLDKLAELANQNAEIQSEIKGFLGDVFCGLFNIIASCNDKLPIDENDSIEEVRMEVVTGKSVFPTAGVTSLESPKEPAKA